MHDHVLLVGGRELGLHRWRLCLAESRLPRREHLSSGKPILGIFVGHQLAVPVFRENPALRVAAHANLVHVRVVYLFLVR